MVQPNPLSVFSVSHLQSSNPMHPIQNIIRSQSPRVTLAAGENMLY